MSVITERLALLRQEMKAKGISAYIITSSDAHLSEYTPLRWQGRSWISGFNGSAGSVVVTQAPQASKASSQQSSPQGLS